MAIRPMHTLLWHLRKMVSPPRARGASDADLLQRFLEQRDESAFELLVWRHGPMVLSVCGRVLSDPYAQEDAFQATFLTLVRKAGSIGKRDAVGSWLYKVAHRVALRARARAAARAGREQPLTDRDGPEVAYTPADQVAWRELRPLLDAEVRLLPEKYRAPFVLCYLEGKTNEEAALELGCPQGTIFSRLARARDLLRTRLARQGMLLEPAFLTRLLAEKAPTGEPVSRQLADTTVSGAVVLVAGKNAAGSVPGAVLELVESIVRQMWLAKVRTICASVAVAVALALAGAAPAVHAYETFVRQARPVRSDGCAYPRDTGDNSDGSGQGTGLCSH